MIDAWTINTPTGPLGLLAEHGVVVAAGFTRPESLCDRLPPVRRTGLVTRSHLGDIGRLVADYFDGRLDALDEIPVDQPGTALQHQVWDGLRAIPAGQTRTYTELAATTDRPRAVRAAGTACGRNLIAPVVPCHRALRRDGSLGGYYYGLAVKRWLLDHEARFTIGT
ncbi:MAG: methylated-DNA--[protein]-cysteine S-methyltransferase [Acidimicrobiales bacterium]